MTTRNHNNTADPVALTIAATAGASVFTVASTAGFPPVPFIIGVERGDPENEEVCLVTAMTATTFTVTRGYDGTTAVAHEVGMPIEHCVAAIDYREANEHINNTALDHHLQYMRADGTRHDLPARHAVGVVVPVGLLSDITTTTPGNAAAAGGSGRAADAQHAHAMPTYATLRDAIIPAGVIEMYAGTTAPAGWVMGDGGVYATATYPNLSAVCGTRYNLGNEGAGNFRVPDLRGRSPMGAGAGTDLTNRTLGAKLGAETKAMGLNELPPHNHPVNDPGHEHGFDGGFSTLVGEILQSTLWINAGPMADHVNADVTWHSTNAHAVTGISTQAVGGGVAFELLHPVFVVNYIIKAS